MDPFGNDEIARLLRLKRYEQPPPAYFENFLSEFRRRQRDEVLRQSPWRICFERAQGFAVQYNVRSLASYAAGIAAVVACAAVISITIYHEAVFPYGGAFPRSGSQRAAKQRSKHARTKVTTD